MVSKKQLKEEVVKEIEASNSVISVYIDSNKVIIIDKVRGDTPRSTWVKNLIDKEITKYDGG